MKPSYFGILLRYLLVFALTALTFNYFIQEGFGRGDFLPLIFWGLPSILINSVVIFYIFRITQKMNLIIRFLIQFIGVVIVSYLGAISYNFLLGAWAFALSINPLPAHLAGALAGSFWIEGKSRNKIKKLTLNLCIYLSMIIFFGVGLHYVSLFIKEKVLMAKSISIVSARKVKKEFNNEQEVKDYYCSKTMQSNYRLFKHKRKYKKENNHWEESTFCSPYNLKAFVELYNSKGVVFHYTRASSYFTDYKKMTTVFLVFPDIYELSTKGEIFKVPKSDSVIYFYDGTSWNFFPKEVKFSKQQIVIKEKWSGSGFCLSIENVPGHPPGRGCTTFLR